MRINTVAQQGSTAAGLALLIACALGLTAWYAAGYLGSMLFASDSSGANTFKWASAVAITGLTLLTVYLLFIQLRRYLIHRTVRHAQANHSLNALLFMLVFATGLPMLVLLAYGVKREIGDDHKDAEQLVSRLAGIAASDTTLYLTGLREHATLLANRVLVRELNPQLCDEIFDEVMKLRTDIANVGTVDGHGRIICSVLKPAEGSKPVAPTISDLAGLDEMLRRHDFVIGSPQRDIYNGRWVLVSAYPIYGRQPKLIGAIQLVVKLSAFQPLSGATLPDGAVAMIIDNKGTVIAHGSQPETTVGQKLFESRILEQIKSRAQSIVDATGGDGTHRLFAIKKINGAGWYAIVGIPSEPIFAAARTNALRTGLLALTMLVLSSILVLLVRKKISAPIEALKLTAMRVAAGQFDQRAPEAGPIELFEVAAGFNAMLDKIPKIAQAVHDSEEAYRTLIDATPNGIRVVCNDRIVLLNPAGKRLLGLSADASLVGLDAYDNIHPDFHAQARRRFRQVIEEKTAVPLIEQQLTRHDGGTIEVEIATIPYSFKGKAAALSIFRDITERKKNETRANQLAYYDQLTALPNRTMLIERTSEALDEAKLKSTAGAVLFIDLDNFKQINDARGHEIGDRVLQSVAKRLSVMVRTHDCIARLGGDEFVALITQLSPIPSVASQQAVAVATKFHRALETPIIIDGKDYSVAASIGIALFPKADESVIDLLREADTAMYSAKAAGRNSVMLFTPDMLTAAQARLSIHEDLNRAIANRELRLYAQSQVDGTGNSVGAELLLRWTHSERGEVSPGEFIPVAEESDLIVRIGDWVLLQACLTLMRANMPSNNLHLSINVSPRQFRQPGFVERVTAIVADTGAPASRLIFEITEGLLMEQFDDVVVRMQQLRALGIRFSIDDFGTGFSNLGYLNNLPIDELKIDKSFVQKVPGSSGDNAIVLSVLSIAEQFNIKVVAEGVETAEQVTFLRQHDCEYMQGYYFAKPVPLELWLANLKM